MPTVEILLLPETREVEVIRRDLDKLRSTHQLVRLKVRGDVGISLQKHRQTKWLSGQTVDGIARKLAISPRELREAREEQSLPPVA